MKSSLLSRALAGPAAVVAVLAVALPAWAVSVTINGETVPFNPPPIERAGRVFVPLRGVFERLGASVVYENGVINATGNGRAISLKIGSTDATVGGQPQTLDVAPFIVGASTYVPLRFVSEALGAGVNYDGTNEIVALTTAGAGGENPPPPPEHHMSMRHILRGVRPGDGATVGSTQPTIEAEFSEPVDANSVRVRLDGRDITSAATLSSSGFVYAPASPLQPMNHTVEVTGMLASGQPFEQSYGFTSGTAVRRIP